MHQKTMRALLYLLVAFPSGKHFREYDYCSAKCPPGTHHTVCLRDNDCSPNINCTEIPNSNSFRSNILRYHNRLRKYIATGQASRLPAASNMNVLSYDADLEHNARCWATLCVPHEDVCRSTAKFDDVGQIVHTVFLDKSYGDNLRLVRVDTHSIIGSWYMEQSRCDEEEIDNYSGVDPTISRFAMLVSARILAIGCLQTVGDNRVYMLVCNYGPAGAIKHKPLYKKGSPCSECGNRACNKEFPGLCGESVFYRRTNSYVARSIDSICMVLYPIVVLIMVVFSL